MKHFTLAALCALSLCSLLACAGTAGEPSQGSGPDGELAEPLAPSGSRFFTITLARGESAIRDLAVDEQGVYYVSAAVSDPNQPRSTLGRVARVGKRGGFPQVVVAQQKGGGSIATNSRNIFWTGAALDASGAEQAALFTRAKWGGRVTRFAPSWAGFIPGTFPGNDPEEPPFLLADEQQVYALGAEEVLSRIPIATGLPIRLIQGADHFAIAMSRQEVFLSEGRNCSSFIAEIKKNAPGSVDQGTPSPYASFIDDPSVVCVVWSMAVSGSTLYWSSILDGVLSAHLNGAPAPADTPQLLVPPDSSDPYFFSKSPRYLAVVPPYVYFTTGDGALKRVAQTGGAPSTVVASDVNPNVRISSDADSVYWVSSAADQIRRTRVR